MPECSLRYRGLYDVVHISCLALWCWIGLLMNYRLVKDRLTGVRFGDCRVTLMVVWHCVHI